MKPDTCPVCDWTLDDNAIAVRAGDASARVCCEECAQKWQSAQSAG